MREMSAPDGETGVSTSFSSQAQNDGIEINDQDGLSMENLQSASTSSVNHAISDEASCSKVKANKRPGCSINTGNVEKKKKKENLEPPKLTEPNRDIFCWKCHKFGNDVMKCNSCPRVYHFKCTQLEIKLNNWTCFQCLEIQRSETDKRTPFQNFKPSDYGKLFEFALKRMWQHEGCSFFENPVDLEAYPDYLSYIVYPKCISEIEEKVTRCEYNSCEAFLADIRWLTHNSYIYNGAHSDLTLFARSLLKMAKQECEEMINCPDCYLHANTLDEDKWFIEICGNPHVLVWAKLKGFPFWPGKVINSSASAAEVRFFGDHNKAAVPIDACFLYSKQMPKKQKKAPGLESAMEEAEKHIQKLEERFGEFHYPPPGIEFTPGDEDRQLKIFLPGFDLMDTIPGPPAPRKFKLKQMSADVIGPPLANKEPATHSSNSNDNDQNRASFFIHNLPSEKQILNKHNLPHMCYKSCIKPNVLSDFNCHNTYSKKKMIKKPLVVLEKLDLGPNNSFIAKESGKKYINEVKLKKSSCDEIDKSNGSHNQFQRTTNVMGTEEFKEDCTNQEMSPFATDNNPVKGILNKHEESINCQVNMKNIEKISHTSVKSKENDIGSTEGCSVTNKETGVKYHGSCSTATSPSIPQRRSRNKSDLRKVLKLQVPQSFLKVSKDKRRLGNFPTHILDCSKVKYVSNNELGTKVNVGNKSHPKSFPSNSQALVHVHKGASSSLMQQISGSLSINNVAITEISFNDCRSNKSKTSEVNDKNCFSNENADSKCVFVSGEHEVSFKNFSSEKTQSVENRKEKVRIVSDSENCFEDAIIPDRITSKNGLSVNSSLSDSINTRTSMKVDEVLASDEKSISLNNNKVKLDNEVINDNKGASNNIPARRESPKDKVHIKNCKSPIKKASMSDRVYSVIERRKNILHFLNSLKTRKDIPKEVKQQILKNIYSKIFQSRLPNNESIVHCTPENKSNKTSEQNNLLESLVQIHTETLKKPKIEDDLNHSISEMIMHISKLQPWGEENLTKESLFWTEKNEKNKVDTVEMDKNRSTTINIKADNICYQRENQMNNAEQSDTKLILDNTVSNNKNISTRIINRNKSEMSAFNEHYSKGVINSDENSNKGFLFKSLCTMSNDSFTKGTSMKVDKSPNNTNGIGSDKSSLRPNEDSLTGNDESGKMNKETVEILERKPYTINNANIREKTIIVQNENKSNNTVRSNIENVILDDNTSLNEGPPVGIMNKNGNNDISEDRMCFQETINSGRTTSGACPPKPSCSKNGGSLQDEVDVIKYPDKQVVENVNYIQEFTEITDNKTPNKNNEIVKKDNILSPKENQIDSMERSDIVETSYNNIPKLDIEGKVLDEIDPKSQNSSDSDSHRIGGSTSAVKDYPRFCRSGLVFQRQIQFLNFFHCDPSEFADDVDANVSKQMHYRERENNSSIHIASEKQQKAHVIDNMNIGEDDMPVHKDNLIENGGRSDIGVRTLNDRSSDESRMAPLGGISSREVDKISSRIFESPQSSGRGSIIVDDSSCNIANVNLNNKEIEELNHKTENISSQRNSCDSKTGKVIENKPTVKECKFLNISDSVFQKRSHIEGFLNYTQTNESFANKVKATILKYLGPKLSCTCSSDNKSNVQYKLSKDVLPVSTKLSCTQDQTYHEASKNVDNKTVSEKDTKIKLHPEIILIDSSVKHNDKNEKHKEELLELMGLKTLEAIRRKESLPTLSESENNSVDKSDVGLILDGSTFESSNNKAHVICDNNPEVEEISLSSRSDSVFQKKSQIANFLSSLQTNEIVANTVEAQIVKNIYSKICEKCSIDWKANVLYTPEKEYVPLKTSHQEKLTSEPQIYDKIPKNSENNAVLEKCTTEVMKDAGIGTLCPHDKKNNGKSVEISVNVASSLAFGESRESIPAEVSKMVDDVPQSDNITEVSIVCETIVANEGTLNNIPPHVESSVDQTHGHGGNIPSVQEVNSDSVFQKKSQIANFLSCLQTNEIVANTVEAQIIKNIYSKICEKGSIDWKANVLHTTEKEYVPLKTSHQEKLTSEPQIYDEIPKNPENKAVLEKCTTEVMKDAGIGTLCPHDKKNNGKSVELSVNVASSLAFGESRESIPVEVSKMVDDVPQSDNIAEVGIVFETRVANEGTLNNIPLQVESSVDLTHGHGDNSPSVQEVNSDLDFQKKSQIAEFLSSVQNNKVMANSVKTKIINNLYSDESFNCNRDFKSPHHNNVKKNREASMKPANREILKECGSIVSKDVSILGPPDERRIPINSLRPNNVKEEIIEEPLATNPVLNVDNTYSRVGTISECNNDKYTFDDNNSKVDEMSGLNGEGMPQIMIKDQRFSDETVLYNSDSYKGRKSPGYPKRPIDEKTETNGEVIILETECKSEAGLSKFCDKELVNKSISRITEKEFDKSADPSNQINTTLSTIIMERVRAAEQDSSDIKKLEIFIREKHLNDEIADIVRNKFLAVRAGLLRKEISSCSENTDTIKNSISGNLPSSNISVENEQPLEREFFSSQSKCFASEDVSEITNSKCNLINKTPKLISIEESVRNIDNICSFSKNHSNSSARISQNVFSHKTEGLIRSRMVHEHELRKLTNVLSLVRVLKVLNEDTILHRNIEKAINDCSFLLNVKSEIGVLNLHPKRKPGNEALVIKLGNWVKPIAPEVLPLIDIASSEYCQPQNNNLTSNEMPIFQKDDNVREVLLTSSPNNNSSPTCHKTEDGEFKISSNEKKNTEEDYKNSCDNNIVSISNYCGINSEPTAIRENELSTFQKDDAIGVPHTTSSQNNSSSPMYHKTVDSKFKLSYNEKKSSEDCKHLCVSNMISESNNSVIISEPLAITKNEDMGDKKNMLCKELESDKCFNDNKSSKKGEQIYTHCMKNNFIEDVGMEQNDNEITELDEELVITSEQETIFSGRSSSDPEYISNDCEGVIHAEQRKFSSESEDEDLYGDDITETDWDSLSEEEELPEREKTQSPIAKIDIEHKFIENEANTLQHKEETLNIGSKEHEGSFSEGGYTSEWEDILDDEGMEIEESDEECFSSDSVSEEVHLKKPIDHQFKMIRANYAKGELTNDQRYHGTESMGKYDGFINSANTKYLYERRGEPIISSGRGVTQSPSAKSGENTVAAALQGERKTGDTFPCIEIESSSDDSMSVEDQYSEEVCGYEEDSIAEWEKTQSLRESFQISPKVQGDLEILRDEAMRQQLPDVRGMAEIDHDYTSLINNPKKKIESLFSTVIKPHDLKMIKHFISKLKSKESPSCDSNVSSSVDSKSDQYDLFIESLPRYFRKEKGSSKGKSPVLNFSEMEWKDQTKLRVIDHLRSLYFTKYSGSRNELLSTYLELLLEYPSFILDIERQKHERNDEKQIKKCTAAVINTVKNYFEQLNFLKKARFCAHCQDSANLNCCFAASYCSPECKANDFNRHKETCTDISGQFGDKKTVHRPDILDFINENEDMLVQEFMEIIETARLRRLFGDDEDVINKLKELNDKRTIIPEEIIEISSDSESSSSTEQTPNETDVPYYNELPLEVILDTNSGENLTDYNNPEIVCNPKPIREISRMDLNVLPSNQSNGKVNMSTQTSEKHIRRLSSDKDTDHGMSNMGNLGNNNKSTSPKTHQEIHSCRNNRGNSKNHIPVYPTSSKTHLETDYSISIRGNSGNNIYLTSSKTQNETYSRMNNGVYSQNCIYPASSKPYQETDCCIDNRGNSDNNINPTFPPKHQGTYSHKSNGGYSKNYSYTASSQTHLETNCSSASDRGNSKSNIYPTCSKIHLETDSSLCNRANPENNKGYSENRISPASSSQENEDIKMNEQAGTSGKFLKVRDVESINNSISTANNTAASDNCYESIADNKIEIVLDSKDLTHQENAIKNPFVHESNFSKMNKITIKPKNNNLELIIPKKNIHKVNKMPVNLMNLKPGIKKLVPNKQISLTQPGETHGSTPKNNPWISEAAATGNLKPKASNKNLMRQRKVTKNVPPQRSVFINTIKKNIIGSSNIIKVPKHSEMEKRSSCSTNSSPTSFKPSSSIPFSKTLPENSKKHECFLISEKNASGTITYKLVDYDYLKNSKTPFEHFSAN